MKKNIISLVIVFCSVILLKGIVIADNIDKGTRTLGGASNIYFSTSDYDDDNVDSTSTLNLSMSGGYFVAKNFELELGIGFMRQETDNLDVNSYSLSPMITYHFPSNERINFIAGIGVRWEKNENDYNSHSLDIDSFGFGMKVGFELFLNANAAITLEASYWDIEWNYDHDQTDLKERRLTFPQIGIKLYF